MERKKRIYISGLLLVLVCGLFASLILALTIGSSELSADIVFSVLMDQIFGNGEGGGTIYTVSEYQIIWNIRLPRVLFGMICGAGLSITGGVMQALVMNPIADPYVLGVSSGASAGAAFALLMPIPFLGGQYQVVLTAMLGALIACGLVYSMAILSSEGQIKPVTLLLSGTAVNAVMSAITSLLVFIARSPEGIASVYNWQMGSIAAAQWSTLTFPMITVLLAGIVFSCCGRKLNLLMMGDEDARSTGMDVKRLRTLLFIGCAVVVASLVSVTGIIGFVGLVIPHITRMITGTSDNRVVLPFSAIIGSVFLVWADAAARGVFGYAELPLGIITAFVGAPFFLYLMMRKRYGGTM